MDALIALRERINREALPAKDGTLRFKLSINDFVVKALALALIGVPQANAVWDDGKIRRLRTADVGIAVAVDDGLYTPVLREVESKSLSALSRESKSLADRARERALRTRECQGGAATVSNLGMFGIDSFAAIINPAAIKCFSCGHRATASYSSRGSGGHCERDVRHTVVRSPSNRRCIGSKVACRSQTPAGGAF